MKTKFVVEFNFLTALVSIVVILSILSLTSASLAQGPQPGQGGDAGPDADVPMRTSTTVEDPLEMAMAATQYLHLSGSGFVQMYSDMSYDYSSGGCVYHTAGSSSHAHMNMAVVLPSNATVTALRYYYYDSNASSNGTLRLRRMDDGDAVTDVAVVSSTGSSGLGMATVSSLSHAIDYVNYSYVLQYNGYVIGSTLRLCGARISYTTPGLFGVALPSVLK